jgi:hypothetical protein
MIGYNGPNVNTPSTAAGSMTTRPEAAPGGAIAAFTIPIVDGNACLLKNRLIG